MSPILTLWLGCASLGDAYTTGPFGIRYAGVPVPDADGRTFEPLTHGWARDARRGYYRSVQVPGSHGTKFVVIDRFWAKDDAQVWFATPSNLADSVIELVPDADPSSFRALGTPDGSWAADRERVYQGSHAYDIVANPEHFGPAPWSAGMVFHDGTQVYYYDNDLHVLVDGNRRPAFAGTLRHLEQTRYLTDDRAIWFQDEVPKALVGVDLASFEALGSTHARDASSAWYLDQRLADAHPTQFRVLDADWAVDDIHVWFRGNQIPGLDAATLTIVNEARIADRRGVWEVSEDGRSIQPVPTELR